MPNKDIDFVGQLLANGGQMAYEMSPSWDGARASMPIVSPGGAHLGRMLPGRGIFINHDLKNLGITKEIPHVYEYTPMMKVVEELTRINESHGKIGLCPERMAVNYYDANRGVVLSPTARAVLDIHGVITSYDGIISARAGGNSNDYTFVKASYTTVANVFSSTFLAGGSPGAGTYTNIPGGAAVSNQTAGALSLGLTNPAGGTKKYLLTLGYGSSSAINWAILADLLVQAGNINANSNSAQSIATTALTRYTNGGAVNLALVVASAVGATPANISFNYTNQAGLVGQVTPSTAMTASAIAQRCQPQNVSPFVLLATGDFGIRSVQSGTFSAAMGGGTAAVELSYPLMAIPGLASQTYIERDSTVQIDGLSELVQDGSANIACLVLYLNTNGATSGTLTGFLRTASG